MSRIIQLPIWTQQKRFVKANSASRSERGFAGGGRGSGKTASFGALRALYLQDNDIQRLDAAALRLEGGVASEHCAALRAELRAALRAELRARHLRHLLDEVGVARAEGGDRQDPHRHRAVVPTAGGAR